MSAGPAILPLASPTSRLAAPLGAHAARGAAWTLVFSVVTKVVTFGSQFALAWFLVPEEFGLVAVVLSLMQFTAVVGSANLRNILVQRTAEFETAAGQVFWLALFLNLGVALLLLTVAPLFGAFFGESRLTSLVLVAALAPPVQSLGTIYLASLQRDLKFRQVAMIQCVASVFQNGSAVLLAWRGFGALSLVLPLVISGAWMAAAYRFASGRIVLGRPNPKCWPELGASIVWLVTHAFFSAVMASGASMVVGMIHPNAAVIGMYFWGYSISSQSIFLLVANLQAVLFPALSRLNSEPGRQFAAVERAVRTLAAAAAPMCALQWLLAGPVLRLCFHARWEPAVPVIEWISLGLMTQPLQLAAVSVFLARGKFRQLAMMTAVASAMVTTGAILGALAGAPVAMARGVAAGIFTAGLFAGWLTYREFARPQREFLRVLAKQFLVTAAIVLAGWSTRSATESVGGAVQAVLTIIAVLGALVVAMDRVLPEVVADLGERLFRRSDRGSTRAASADGLPERGRR